MGNMFYHGAFPCNIRANYKAQLWGKVKFDLRGTLITLETREIGFKNNKPHVKLFFMKNELF